MRKFLSLTLAAVMLAGMLVIPAAAENNGTAALTDVSAAAGSTAAMTLSLDDFGMANTIGVSISLPEGLNLDKKASEWLLDGDISDISDSQAAWASMDLADVDTDILSLSVSVPETAEVGTEYTVSCTVQIKDNKELLGSVTATGKITVVPSHVHEYVPTVVQPTCVDKGYTLHVCQCGDKYKDTSVAALGHKYDDNVDGTCNRCSADRAELEYKYRQVVHMFRMYNPNTGEHFYTGSEEERDNLIGHGWQYEGIGFTFPANTGVPVYRLFQPSTGEHLYTMDAFEKNNLMASGWNYEGIAFNSAYDTEAVQHRLHNPNETVGAYHFTFSLEEKQNLIDAGWEYQGIGWYSCWK